MGPAARASDPARGRPGYRWVVLAGGFIAQGLIAGAAQGLPIMGPAFRAEFHASLSELGFAFGATYLGTMLSVGGWGWLCDRIGERAVHTAGLAAAAVFLFAAGMARDLHQLVIAFFLFGIGGAGINTAGGRAVAGWFSASQRGFAMGLRQMSVPLGSALAALVLPRLAGTADASRGVLAAAGACAVVAVIAWALIRDPDDRLPGPGPAPVSPLRSPDLWRMVAVSFLLVVPQFAFVGYTVVFLHDQRGMDVIHASYVLAGIQLLGAVGRITLGILSDTSGRRAGVLLGVALALAAGAGATSASLGLPLAVTVGLVLAGGTLSVFWTGLAYTVTAELVHPSVRGFALGLQNIGTFAGAMLALSGFAVFVTLTSWTAGFILLAACALSAALLLVPLAGREPGGPSRPGREDPGRGAGARDSAINSGES